MKINPIIFLVLALAFSSCDAPLRTQRVLDSSSSTLKTANSPTVNITTGATTSTSQPAATTSPSTGSSTSVPSDATHCQFSTDGQSGFESNSSHIGEYTLCQSSTDKNNVYFQLKTPPTNSNGDVSICLIPTTNSGTNSIYIGNPMCGYFKDPNAIRKISFIKFPAYTNATVTGVLFFKDLSWYYGVPYNQYLMTLEAYKVCMNMPSYPYFNSTYCQAFKSVGQYVYKQF